MRGRAGILRALEGEPGVPAWASGALAALSPAGWVYGAWMGLRRRLYEGGLLRESEAPVPVLSVGNLTLGGTGKTPAVAWALERLLGAGRRPAVVSRGYGGASEAVTVVGDGRGSVLPCPPAADEAVMLARRFPQTPLLTGRDRPAAARRAAKEFGAELVLLDDGFQHLALWRNLDLVLLRGECPFGNGRVFPAGALREPRGALRRADVVLMTGDVDFGGLRQAERRREVEAAAPRAQIFAGFLVPEVLLDGGGNAVGRPADLAGAAVVAVSGIARPEGFSDALSRLGAVVRRHHAHPDHAAYTPAAAERLLASLHETGADLIVTTEKDAVKLAPLLPGGPLRVLRVGFQIDRGDALAARLLEAASGGVR